MRGQTDLIGLVALGVTWRLAAQHVGIGTSAPDARLHVQTPSTDDFIRTGWFQNQRDAADNNGVLIDIARAATDAYALNVRSGVGAGLTSRLYVRGDGNVGIGTTSPGFGLDVEKGIAGLTFAKFGNHHPLYITAAWPNIGFNLYYDIFGWRFGKGSTGHYGGVIGVNPATGTMSIYTSNSGNAGNVATLTERVTILQNGNVGIGTVTPAERLHVVGRAIVHDGLTGTPTNSTWGSDGSRIILWPGSATVTPYQIGIAPSEMWTGVPSWASWSVFRGTDRQLIVRAGSPICHVNGNYGFPSIMLGNFGGGLSSGPFPKRGTFVYFAGPTNDFESNSDPALMYFVHLASNESRLRLHVEDDGSGDGFSILGASCGADCFNLAASSLLFDFVTNGQAYKPGGGSWTAFSDARLKEDIRPYTRGLAELRALRPVRYRYKKEYWAASDRHFTGLIAQEVQDVVPEMVHPYKFQAIGDKLLDVLAVDPSDLTYMLINAVKELDAENQQLKARLAAVEAEKQTLEARLSVIESRLSALEGLRGSKE
jgi:hypothetical protein